MSNSGQQQVTYIANSGQAATMAHQQQQAQLMAAAAQNGQLISNQLMASQLAQHQSQAGQMVLNGQSLAGSSMYQMANGTVVLANPTTGQQQVISSAQAAAIQQANCLQMSNQMSQMNQLVQVQLANGQIVTTTLASLQGMSVQPQPGPLQYATTGANVMNALDMNLAAQAQAPPTQYVTNASGQIFALTTAPQPTFINYCPSLSPQGASGQQYLQVVTPQGIQLIPALHHGATTSQQVVAAQAAVSTVSQNDQTTAQSQLSDTASDATRLHVQQIIQQQQQQIFQQQQQQAQLHHPKVLIKKEVTNCNSDTINSQQAGGAIAQPPAISIPHNVQSAASLANCEIATDRLIIADGVALPPVRQQTECSTPSSSASSSNVASNQQTVSSTTPSKPKLALPPLPKSQPPQPPPCQKPSSSPSPNSPSNSDTSHLHGHVSMHATPSVSPGASMEPESTTQSTVSLSLGKSSIADTINNTDAAIVDGVNLEEIKVFAKQFKLRRLSLGLTQTQVGQALSATEGPSYSQSAICRFEKLDITPKSAQKIKPVLESWMTDAEDRLKNGGQPMMDFMGNESNKKRKRRTSFAPLELEHLNTFFQTNTHPSGSEMTELADILKKDREVVRVWFCNKRQALRNTIKAMSTCSSSLTW